MNLKEYKVALNEEKDNLFYKIGQKIRIAKIGILLSASLVIVDGLTYVNKTKHLINDPKIKEILAIENEEQRLGELENIFQERNYYEKLDKKYEKSENIFKIAWTGAKASLAYLLLGPLLSVGNYYRKKRNLKDKLDRRNL